MFITHSLSFFPFITLFMASIILRKLAIAFGFSKPEASPRRAYVTFLAGNGDYVKGVVALAKGLRKVSSAYPLVVAVLPDVPESHRSLLVSQGCIVRRIEPVCPPENGTDKLARAYYLINYSKLRIWEFVEYSKMVYLDADMHICSNIDHLFDLPDGKFYAAMDCCPDKTWSDKPQFGIRYCQKQAAEITDPAAEMGESSSLYFNAGMFVFEPSITTRERLFSALKMAPQTPFAEQDLLNMFFRDVYKPIPQVYNFLISMLWLHPESIQLGKVRVVHFCVQGSKPWRYTGTEENLNREEIRMLVNNWWAVYNDPSLDYKMPVGGEVAPAGMGTAFAEAVGGHAAFVGCMMTRGSGGQDTLEVFGVRCSCAVGD